MIIWLYATLGGELETKGRLSIVKLNPSKLIYGFSKLNDEDFIFKAEFTRNNTNKTMISVLDFDFKEAYQFGFRAGLSLDADLFLSGIRVANARAFIGTKADLELSGKGAYGTFGMGSPWNWSNDPCIKGKVGAGLVVSANAKFGLQLNTAWGNEAGSFSYSGQSPTKDDLEKPGWNYTWFNDFFADSCQELEPEVTIDSTTVVTEWDYEGDYTFSVHNSGGDVDGEIFQITPFDSNLGELIQIERKMLFLGQWEAEMTATRPVHLELGNSARFRIFIKNASNAGGSDVTGEDGGQVNIAGGETFGTLSGEVSLRQNVFDDITAERNEFQVSASLYAGHLLADHEGNYGIATLKAKASGVLETTYVYEVRP